MIVNTPSVTVQQQQKHADTVYKDQKKQDTADKYGQLGLGHKHQGKNYTIPKICCYNLVIRTVSCGEDHSAFITCTIITPIHNKLFTQLLYFAIERGHIYTIGSNEDGKLGISTKSIPFSSTPCLVEELSKIKCLSLSCGQSHTVAVMQNGEVYGWGDGTYGQLGNGKQESTYSPTRIVSENNEFIQSHCGARHTVLLDIKKRVYVCGSNENGQLGLKNSKLELFIKRQEQKGVIEAACGQYHTLLLDENGRVYASGANSFGQLGIGTKNNLYEFTQLMRLEGEQIFKIAAGSHSAALSRKGDIYMWGTGVFGEYLLPHKIHRHSTGTSFSDISVGSFFAAAVDINGTVWTWGANSNGELGLGDYESKTTHSILQALKGRHVQKICCGGGFALALGNKISKESKQTIPVSASGNLQKQAVENNSYLSSQSQQGISLKHNELKQLQNDYNSLYKNYSTVSNHNSIKPTSLNQNHSMVVERTAPRFKESSHSPLQKSFHFEKKPTSSTTTKKIHKSDISPSGFSSKNNVLQENNSQLLQDKKRKPSVERLCTAYKESIVLENKKNNWVPSSSSVERRSISQTKGKKKSSISQSLVNHNQMMKNEMFHSQLNKENIQDEPTSSKRMSKKQLHSTLQIDSDQIERFNNKIKQLEKKLVRETTEKITLKSEIGILKENLDDIQFGRDGLNSISETMQSQYSKLYNLQNEYDALLTKFEEREILLQNKQAEQQIYIEQVNQTLKELARVKEENLKKEQEIYELKDEIHLLVDDKRNSRSIQNQQLENLIQQLQLELSDTKLQNSSYKNISETYRQEIETLRRAIENFKEIEEKEKRSREELQRQNEQLKNEAETYRSRFEDAQSEKEEYIAELRRVKKEKEKENINGMHLEDSIRELNHERNKVMIERNQIENELMNLKERVQASERQEMIAEKKIQELSQIKQSYEFDNQQLKQDLNHKINEQNCLNDRVTVLMEKLQSMEEKNTQLTVLLNQEIEKQALEFRQSRDNSLIYNSAEKKQISTSDLILNNQFSHSSKKSIGRQQNENLIIKSMAYSDQKQFGENRNDLLRSENRQKSKSIDASFNISQKTGSQHKTKQNQILNNSNNLSYHIQTQPFDPSLRNSNKSLDHINNLSSLSVDQLPTFSEYDFSNTKPFQNSTKKYLDKSAERYTFTPDQQQQKNHIFVQDSYEQMNKQQQQQPSQYKVRSASAQKLLNLIERNGEQTAKQVKATSPLRKTPEKMVTFQQNADQYANEYSSPFNLDEIHSKSNKKQQLEQIQEEQQIKDPYEAKDLLELTNVRKRLAEMRKTKDMVFSRMMDFDQKIKKFTEQQEKVLNKK